MAETTKKPKWMMIDIKWLIPVIVIPLIGWCVSIEVRMSSGLSSRVASLEAALTPVLIDYGIQKELAARGIKIEPPAPVRPPPSVGPPLPKEEEIKKIRAEQEMKIREQFPNARKQ